MSYPTLTYPELRKIVWMIADQIRDKGRGNSNDYMAITVGILFLKRLMDMRAESKREYYVIGSPKNSVLSLNNGDIDATILNDQANKPEFAVSEDYLHTFRAEWSDIASFAPNNTGDEIQISYKDGLGGQQLKTTAPNKFALLKECLEAFSHPKIHEIFATFNFLPKVYNQNTKDNILDHADFEEIIEELNAYDFGLEHADEDIFADVYMDLLGRFASEGGKKGGEFFTPTKVVRGAIKFLDVEPKERKIVVADIAAGACTFMIEFANAYKEAINRQNDPSAVLNDRIEFVTGEKERTSYALGNANMLLHGYSDNHVAFNANSITEYDTQIGANHRQKVDYLLMNPPYGLKDYGRNITLANKNMPRWAYGVPNKGDGEMAFLLTAVDMLSDEGKAVLIMPLGTLFRDSTMPFRKRLIEKDWVEGIVELPNKMFLTTSIPVCIWVINKRKKVEDQGKIFLINASQEFSKSGKNNDWSEDKAVETYLSRTEVKGFSREVEVSEIESTGYTLSLSRYISSQVEDDDVDIIKLLSESEKLMESAQAGLSHINQLITKINLDKQA